MAAGNFYASETQRPLLAQKFVTESSDWDTLRKIRFCRRSLTREIQTIETLPPARFAPGNFSSAHFPTAFGSDGGADALNEFIFARGKIKMVLSAPQLARFLRMTIK
ncbi:MAG: hypothetical protein ACREFE_20560 [Limisphaerales bacterium]